jgi:hypothetical protein
MSNKSGFTKFLAIAGTILVGLPVIAPIFFSLILLVTEGRFLFDFLMPAELFPFVLAGSVLLIWAALRARSFRKPIIWCAVIGIVMLFGSQGLAIASGLAHGETEPAGIWWALVVGMLVLYDLAVLAVGVCGILLIKNLFRPQLASEKN